VISQRSDYLFVTIPASIQVNDEVMPKRYANEEKRKVLRGLDAAMMIECVGERNAVLGTVAQKKNMTREILGEPFATAASWCAGNCGPSSPWRAQSEESQGLWDRGNESFSQAYRHTISALLLESDPADFLSGKPLCADKLMKLYRDMNKFRRFIAPISSTTLSSSNYAITSDYAGGYDPTVDHDIADLDAQYSSGGSSMGGTEIYFHRSINLAGTIFESRGRYEFTASVASGTYRATVNANARMALYGAHECFARIYTNCTAPAGTWYDWVPVTAGKHTAEGYYGVAAQSLVAAAAQAREYHNVPALGMNAVPHGMTGQSITQRVLDLALVVDLTDHTDFSQWLTDE
jgi:hypothetical protein